MSAAPITLTAYAQRRGVSKMAVSLAIKSGRLSACVARDAKGRPQISDPELADREWAATTKERHVPIAVQERQAAAPPPVGPPAAPTPPPEVDEDGQLIPPRTISAARREAAEARLAELELAREEGRVILAQDVESHLANVFTQCKTKLLGVPSRARQQDPNLSAEQVSLLDGLVREALEGLAVPGEVPPNPPPPARPRKRTRSAVAA